MIERTALVLESALVPVEDMATVLRRLLISGDDYMDSLKSLEEDLESARASIEGCKAGTDLEKLETMLDGLAGSAQSLGAFRLGPVLKTMSETCRERDISRIQESGAQLLRELRILQSAVEVMRYEQARVKNSSKAGSYSMPMARGLIWKQVANKPAEAVSK